MKLYIIYVNLFTFNGRRGRDHMVVWLKLYVQSVPITTKVVSSNPDHGEVYSIQRYEKACQWLAAGRWLSSVSSINTTDRYDITEILLKVVLN
jgi:hypothetical protein